MTAAQIEIVRYVRRHCPDQGLEELAVNLGVRLRDVKRAARGIEPESESKVRAWRRAVGVLAEKLAEKGEKFPAIAAMAGISRQHLVTCRREAQEQGTVQP
jgi:hypothetical protein